MAPLFSGIDTEMDVVVVFYIRPQTEWIPSGWRQRGMKAGMSMLDFANQVMRTGNLANLAAIEAWETALPKAQIVVRPFFRETMVGNDPASDFFSLIGFDGYDPQKIGDVANASFDYSLMHVMYRNAKRTFERIEDQTVELELLPKLAAWARSSNARMISDNLASRIEAHYRDENKQVLKRYCGIEDVDAFYDKHYSLHPAGPNTYMDMDETEILVRCFRLLMEACGVDRASASLGEMLKP